MGIVPTRCPAVRRLGCGFSAAPTATTIPTATTTATTATTATTIATAPTIAIAGSSARGVAVAADEAVGYALMEAPRMEAPRMEAPKMEAPKVEAPKASRGIRSNAKNAKYGSCERNNDSKRHSPSFLGVIFTS
jgi:hypothetical protein